MAKRLLITMACLILALTPALAQPADGQLPEVIDARVSATPERARLILDLTAPTAFAVTSLATPRQIAVDVKASSVKMGSRSVVAGAGIVSKFSVEVAEAGRIRTWLMLAGPAKVQQAYVLEAFDDQPARLVVDLVPATEEEFSARAASDLATTIARLDPQLNGGKTEDTALSSQFHARPLIVIDPGHGGADSGAKAPNGIQEKDIVLDFSRLLRKLLVETGRFDVALTRDDDTFLRLEERVNLARQNKADLFVSIHADYFQDRTARGASVYMRDETATDVLDKVLADGENRVDIVAGYALPQMEDRVVNILVDLMRREMRRQSYGAAEAIVAQLEPSVKMRRFPVRRANFFVLQAPDVPSVLVELGFMSNNQDVDNLTTEEWRDRVAQALTRGISTYFDTFAQR